MPHSPGGRSQGNHAHTPSHSSSAGRATSPLSPWGPVGPLGGERDGGAAPALHTDQDLNRCQVRRRGQGGTHPVWGREGRGHRAAARGGVEARLDPAAPETPRIGRSSPGRQPEQGPWYPQATALVSRPILAGQRPSVLPEPRHQRRTGAPPGVPDTRAPPPLTQNRRLKANMRYLTPWRQPRAMPQRFSSRRKMKDRSR